MQLVFSPAAHAPSGMLPRMDITFLGATGTVTGAKYLLRNGRHQVLVAIADCSRATSSCGCATGSRCRSMRPASTR